MSAEGQSVTIAKDWLSLVISVVVLLGVVYGWSRAIARWNGLEDSFTKSMNGLGERLGRVETTVAHLDARADAADRAVDRATGDLPRIHERIGKAEKMAENCGDNMGQIQADIAARVNDMRLYGDREFSRLRERLAALEKEVDIRLRGNGRP